jgi:WXXGXW repeat (2 copies)
MKHGLIAALLLLASCARGGAPPAPIPPPQPEMVPKPPVSAVPLTWQPGHWDWTGSSYVWVPGQYVDAAGHGGSWMPAWWEDTASGWVWHPAHWL